MSGVLCGEVDSALGCISLLTSSGSCGNIDMFEVVGVPGGISFCEDTKHLANGLTTVSNPPSVTPTGTTAAKPAVVEAAEKTAEEAVSKLSELVGKGPTEIVHKGKELTVEIIEQGGKHGFIDADGAFVEITESQIGGTEGSLTNPAGYFGYTGQTTIGGLINGAAHALFVYTAVQFLGPMFGFEQSTTDALAISGSLGIFSGEGVAGFLTENPTFLKEYLPFLESFSPTAVGIGVGVAVAAIAFLLLYSEDEKKIVKFTCLPWQAPTGGERCEECNLQSGLPCSEYQCKSLGQSCELLNPGTGEEKCVWVNRQDVNPPTIEPWEDALLDDYRYSPDNSISPPDRGVKINYLKANDNCIPAFTPLKFGVLLNEPAKCKIDVLRKENFKEMTSFMNGGLSNYSHSYALSLPGKSALESENITLQNNGNYEMYVRCEDANGNSNTATFVFKYCVDPGPDTTPPLIVTTSIINNAPIAYNQSSIDLEVYINEPSNCKWSHDNQDYNSMEEEMQCLTSIFEYNAQMLYKCSTTLTGLKDRIENKFYFRCKDQPNSPENEKNTNKQSYEFNLIGTQPLVIDSVSPNDTTVSDSTDSVKVTLEVETSAGNKEGESICYYSNTGNENNYIKFFETQSFKHTQDLFLAEGDYEYYIKCTDLGGNSDYETINFDVETDSSSPLVVRAYKEENFLKLITNEESECIYSTFGCSYEFSEGTKITVVDETKHFTDWNVQTDLYVKCQDNFGNQPLPNQCSIIVRASNF